MTEPTAAEAALEQRATDPRNDPPVIDQTVTPEPVLEGEPPTPEPVVEPLVKAKKTAEEVLKGRVGHLTKTLSEKDQALQDFQARLDAAEALLAAKVEGDGTVIVPSTGKPASYSQADFEAAVTARAEADAFNRKADDLYNTGATKYTDWKDTVDNLVVSGFMNKDLLDAAMAVDGGDAVLHHLGSNLDEAERISLLSPVRKAAEMAKLSVTLNTPKTVPVSSAPAPIRPVSGSPSPQVDLQRISDEGDMSSYIAARAKQGSRWAQPKGQRAG